MLSNFLPCFKWSPNLRIFIYPFFHRFSFFHMIIFPFPINIFFLFYFFKLFKLSSFCFMLCFTSSLALFFHLIIFPSPNSSNLYFLFNFFSRVPCCYIWSCSSYVQLSFSYYCFIFFPSNLLSFSIKLLFDTQLFYFSILLSSFHYS